MSQQSRKVALRAVRALAEFVDEFDNLYADEARALEKVLVICMREAGIR